MTNNELLHASLLDILFDGRNKDYGAYQLRRDYNQRLFSALGLGLSIILLFILLNALKKDSNITTQQSGRNGIQITEVVLPDPKKKDPEKSIQKEKPKPPQVAAAKVTPPIIVPDNKADKEAMATQEDMINKQISTINAVGKDDDRTVIDEPISKAESTGEADIIIKPEPIKPSSAPEFPGGFEALRKFLFRYLATPDQLGMNAGEKTMVKARFVVGKDGSISVVEIIESGGNIFDKEVMRVCKKMPKWKPAIQNGEPVSTNYVLPVTFVNEEQ